MLETLEVVLRSEPCSLNQFVWQAAQAYDASKDLAASAAEKATKSAAAAYDTTKQYVAVRRTILRSCFTPQM